MRTSIFHEDDSEANAAWAVANMIGRMLATANVGRRARLLDVAAVRGLIGEVAACPCPAAESWPVPIPYATAHGGNVRSSNRTNAYTTLALVARVEGLIRVGITLCPAYKPTPGRAWPSLQPWRDPGGFCGPGWGLSYMRWHNWSTYFDVVQFEDPEIDAFLARPEIGPDLPEDPPVRVDRHGRVTTAEPGDPLIDVLTRDYRVPTPDMIDRGGFPPED